MIEVDFSVFPQLETSRLILRRPALKDIPVLFSLRSDAETMQYIGKPLMKSMNEAEALHAHYIQAAEANTGITWNICMKNSDEMIGKIGIWRIIKEHHRGELGYMLLPQFRQKGIMQEALQAVLNYGFTELHLHSFEASINPMNAASRKLLEKNGFVQEAHFKENYFFNGKFEDSVILSLLSSHFRPVYAP